MLTETHLSPATVHGSLHPWLLGEWLGGHGASPTAGTAPSTWLLWALQPEVSPGQSHSSPTAPSGDGRKLLASWRGRAAFALSKAQGKASQCLCPGYGFCTLSIVHTMEGERQAYPHCPLPPALNPWSVALLSTCLQSPSQAAPSHVLSFCCLSPFPCDCPLIAVAIKKKTKTSGDAARG